MSIMDQLFFFDSDYVGTHVKRIFKIIFKFLYISLTTLSLLFENLGLLLYVIGFSATLKPFFKNLSAQYGRFKKLNEPRLIGQDQALFVVDCEKDKLDITIWLNEQDKITSLLFLPHKPDLPVSERNETELSLPFEGKWLVVWGGDTKELNQHHDTRN